MDPITVQRTIPHEIVHRILLQSRQASDLSDAELLAVLIGRGTYTELALRQSKALLADFGNDLFRLATANAQEITAVHGIGQCIAVNILAALEFARRKRTSSPMERVRIATSIQAHEELAPVLSSLGHEEFWVLLMDRGMRLIERRRISSGGVHGTVADPKLIFKAALDKRASCMVVAHNHPSGQLRPSEEDIHLTRKLVDGGRFLDIQVQDHLIVTDLGFYSFADNGLLH